MGVAADDDVVEFKDCLDAAFPFITGQDAELEVVEVVECFTGTARRGHVDWFDWKVVE